MGGNHHACFPEVAWQNPQKEAPLWSLDGGLVLRRNTNRKEANVSAQVKILENAGLIRGWKKGKFTHYDIIEKQITLYLEFLNHKLV